MADGSSFSFIVTDGTVRSSARSVSTGSDKCTYRPKNSERTPDLEPQPYGSHGAFLNGFGGFFTDV